MRGETTGALAGCKGMVAMVNESDLSWVLKGPGLI